MSGALQDPAPPAAVKGRWLRSPVALWRLARALVHILGGLVLAHTGWDRMDPRARHRYTIDWSSRMLNLLGVRVVVHGAPHAGPKLGVANHISWLDIVTINSVMPSRFVSKAEVGQWPLLGRLVTAAGTLYLVRERRRDAMRVLGLMAQALRDGDTVAVFPEGTTGAGDHVMHFHANLVQSAIDAPAPVQPVVLSYREAGHPQASPSAAYVGDLGLLESLWLVVTARDLTVHVDFLAAQSVDHADRRALTEQLHADMSARLQEARART
ncbi:MAG: 1-acyl-sn-glycerol-3-phosphate acyltransferase [Burkholderiales bacterium]|nr:1-acyl-sn-glycerol-3-phosphate acyltransferase [Burkholderiales bacterium]MBH2015320.1 1-acyl-sn-glycerol-3-phosphate acyltransferase [Burkholderiales bacterium]